MKTIATAYTILSIAGSILMADDMGTLIDFLLKTENGEITYIAISLVNTAFYASILFAIAQILENTEEALYNSSRNNSAQTQGASNYSNSRLNLSSISSKSNGASTWRCPECGKTNPNSSRTCKDCGYQK